MFTKSDKKKNTSTGSSVIAIRVSDSLRKDLEDEMHELGLTRMSTYMMRIISRRKSRTRSGTASAEGLGRKEYDALVSMYGTLLKEVREASRKRNPDGSPAINTEWLQERIKGLNDRTSALLDVLNQIGGE